MSTLSTNDILQHLNEGIIEMEGYVPWGSNYTFVVQVTCEELEIQAVYKPRRGERPLWDFPTGTLCLRERAAYLISEAVDWRVVPPTILRHGPQGWGSVQFFVDHDPNENYFTFKDDYLDQLQEVALFDMVINNADRKGGHVIVDDDNHVWGIDHGIAFHNEPKLRTVIWEFAGRPIGSAQLARLEQLASQLVEKGDLNEELKDLLNNNERQALLQRIHRILRVGIFPEPGPGRPYPWPLV